MNTGSTAAYFMSPTNNLEKRKNKQRSITQNHMDRSFMEFNKEKDIIKK